MIVLATIFFVVVVVGWAALNPNSSIFYPTFRRGPKSSRRVALTFDDGPCPAMTPVVLDILKERGARATFFCVGKNIEAFPEVAARIHREGHLLAGHGREHSLRSFFRHPPAALDDLLWTGRLIAGVTGWFPRFHRPPAGVKTPPGAVAFWKTGVCCAGWTLRAFDGGSGTLSPAKVARLAARVGPGGIMLLHDARTSLGGAVVTSPEAVSAMRESLPALIDGVRARGLDFATVDELAGLPPGMPDPLPDDGPRSSLALVRDLLRAFVFEKAPLPVLCLSLGVGILVGNSPFFGLHTFLGLLLAMRFRLHKLAVFAGTQVTNPFTLPLVLWANIQTGWLILNGETLSLSLRELEKMDVWGEVLPGFFLAWFAGFPVFSLVLSLAVCAVMLSARAALSLFRPRSDEK